MCDCPLFLVHGQQVDATPYPDGAGEIAGDHSAAGGVEPDQHDGVHVGLALLLRRLGVLIPYRDATYAITPCVPLSHPIASTGLNGCHSIAVGVIALDS